MSKTLSPVDRLNRIAAIGADKRLSPSTRHLHAVMLAAFYNSKTGECNPSLRTLATAAGMKRDTVIAGLKQLAEHGYITYPDNDGGRCQKNCYSFAETVPQTGPFETDETVQSAGGNGPIRGKKRSNLRVETVQSAGLALTSEEQEERTSDRTGGPPADAGDPALKRSRSPVVGLTVAGDKNIEIIPPSPARVGRASRLAEDWLPTQEDVEYAKEKLPGADLALVFESFRNHWLGASGQRAIKVSWNAAWRKWCCDEVKYRRNPNSGSRSLVRAMYGEEFGNE
jgi:hypothetical protein